MRRPLPPELVVLGDQLEAAASRALGRRRTRRQMVLNAAASLVVGVPLAISLATSQFASSGAPVSTPTPTPASSVQAVAVIDGAEAREQVAFDDFPPRQIRRQRTAPNSELLVLPSSLRPALR